MTEADALLSPEFRELLTSVCALAVLLGAVWIIAVCSDPTTRHE